MGYIADAPKKVHEETRAVICRGFVVSPSSKALGDALFAWTKKNDGKAGDMSLQFIAHSEDLASEWDAAAFVIGVFIREVFGLDDDHRLGLTDDELAAKCAEADARLDALEPSLKELVAKHDAQLSPRKLLFTWGGPLPSAKLVRGVWREEAADDEYYWSVSDPSKPAFYFSRVGGSQDEAPGGAFGHLVCEGIYDNSDPPIELTKELLRSGSNDERLFAFSMYD